MIKKEDSVGLFSYVVGVVGGVGVVGVVSVEIIDLLF